MKTKSPLFRIDRLLIAALAFLAVPQVDAQLYYQTNGTNATWTSAVWNTTGSGTFNSNWVSTTNVIFGTASGGTNLVTFATTTVGDITVNGNTTITAAGTASAKSGGSTITVADGVTLNWAGQNWSATAANQILTKNGNGTWLMAAQANAASTAGSSFTLNAGTIGVGGNNNFGGALGVLNLNGGVIFNTAASARTFGNAVVVGGNFGMSNTNTSATVNWTNNFNLGAAVRTITNSAVANITFSGLLTNTGGITLTGNGTAAIIFSGTNTYTGKTTLASGTLILTNAGRAGATSSDLDVTGGVLNLGAGTKTNAAFLISGGTITNGTLQATTYALQGGTVDSSVTLGTGTATVATGTTTLNGLLNATTVNVNTGTLNLGAADRLANGAAVTIAGGTLGMGANNDTVSAFTMTSGTLGGSGTLTAASYSLQGGTITANLGSGAATNSAGTTTLDGTLGSTNLVVSGGTINLGTANRLDNGMAVSISGGTLGMGANNDTVGSFVISSGTLGGSGTLTASTYALNGGTVNANLGAGAATASSGTTALNGTLAGNLTVSGGTVNLGSADRISGSSTVQISSGTLGLGEFNDTVSAFTISGTGTLGGSGTLTASTYALQGGTVTANLGAGTLSASANAALNGTAAAATINATAGTLTLGSASRLTGTTPTLNISGGATVAIGGNESIGTLNLTNGTLSGSGTFTASNYNVEAGTLSAALGSGTMTKTTSGTVTVSGASSSSGSATINAGRLNFTANNENRTVTVNSTGTIGGTGSVGATTINSGGTMSPGLSPGSQTYSSLVWEGGGNYNWQLHDATGVAGTGYDTFVSTGAFTINATSGNKFNINLWTLSGIGPDTNGSSINFSGTSDYTWTLGSFGSISGFAANAFSINTSATNGTSGFANLFSGTFSVSTNATQLLLVYTAPVVSSVYTWDTTDGVWSVGANWTGASAPTNTSSLVFAGASGGVSTNDNHLNDISSLTFSNTAGSYTLEGSAFTNGVSGVVNNSASAQTINNDITLGGAQIFNAASGDLTFGGAINNNDNLLTVAGAANTALNGAVSGSAGLTKSGNGSLTLGGNNSFTGALNANGGTTLVSGTQATTTVNVGGGTLLLGADNVLANSTALALNNGAVNLGGFSDTISTYSQVAGTITNGSLQASTYNLTGGTMGAGLNGGAVTVGGNVSLSGAITNGASVNVTSLGTLTFTVGDLISSDGTLTNSGGTINLGGFSDTISTYSQVTGTITNGSLQATTYNLTGGTMGAGLNGGTVNVGGNVSLSGAITNGASVNITNGTLTYAANDRIGDNSSVTVNGGTLNLATFSDTISTYSQVAGTITNGSLQATSYNLTGGTMGAGLNGGAVTVGGNVSLSGTITNSASVNVTSLGTLTFTAGDRISSDGTLTNNGGTINLGGFSDTISTYSQVAGTITNGSLQATSYNLTGGTMGAGLNGGAVTVGGNVALSGTITNGASVNITNGTLTYAANDRIGDNSTVTVNGGMLDLATFTDTVSTYSQLAGTITNGSLQAATYTLNGGTMGAGLNGGAVTVGGNVSLSGTITNGASVNVTSGTLSLAAADRIGSNVNVTNNGGTINLGGFSDTVGVYNQVAGTITNGTIGASSFNVQAGTVAASLTGAGAFTKSGAATATLSGDNTGYSGPINVGNGTLLATHNNAFGSSSVTVTNGGVQAANGITIANGFTIGSAASFSTNLATLRVGDGTTTLGNTGGPLSLLQLSYGGTLLQTINISTNSLQVVGSSTAEGQLSTSPDSGTLIIAGYVPPYSGTGSLSGRSAANAPRGYVTIDSSGTVSSATTIAGAYSAQSIRSGVTVDGSAYWFAGGAGANSGVLAVSSSGTNQLVSVTARVINLYNNDIYYSTQNGIFKITGTPTSSNSAPVTILSGVTGQGSSTYDFVFSPDGNTLYVADDGVGVQKFTYNGTAWSLAYNITNGLAANRAYGLEVVFGATNQIFWTSPTNVWTALDTGSATNATSIYTTGTTSYAVRGIETWITGAAASGSGTLGINEAGSATFSGAITNNTAATLTAASGGLATFSGAISGVGSVTKTGEGTVTLSGANTYSGGTTLSNGVLRLTTATAAGTGSITQTTNNSTLEIDTPGTITNNMSVYNVAFLDGATLSGTITVNNATFDVVENETSTISGAVGGGGGVTKTGLGQLTLSGNNTFSGATAVNAGVLELASTVGGAAASTSSVSVASGATLLISQSNQVNNSASVSLSGGTITRGSGVSEVFGNLNLTEASFLDFGTGAVGTLSFAGTYTPSALLTVQNFLPGNTLTFGSDLTSTINNGALFSFQGDFTSSWNSGTSTFTITAIPEPSTYAAAAGLLGLMLWPSRKRIIRDAKKILGLRAPMRDRLAAKRA